MSARVVGRLSVGVLEGQLPPYRSGWRSVLPFRVRSELFPGFDGFRLVPRRCRRRCGHAPSSGNHIGIGLFDDFLSLAGPGGFVRNGGYG